MKTKKSIYFRVICIIVLGMNSCKTNAEKEAELNNKILTLSDDSIVASYLKGVETNQIKEHVTTYCEEMISNTEDRTEAFHVLGLEKSIGTDSATKFLLTPPESIYDEFTKEHIYSGYTMHLIISNSVSLKGNIYAEVKKRKDLLSALWLFVIDPQMAIDRLNAGYYPEESTIAKVLPEYCSSKNKNIGVITKVLKVSSNEAITKNLGAFDTYLLKNDPKRLQKIYGQMDCFTFTSYYETYEWQGRLKSVDWGKQFFLKEYLAKSTAEDLAILFHIGAINEKTLIANMKGKQLKEEPVWE